MTPQSLNYLLFGVGIGLLVQPFVQLTRGDAAEAAPFAAVGIGLWVFALVRIRRASREE